MSGAAPITASGSRSPAAAAGDRRGARLLLRGVGDEIKGRGFSRLVAGRLPGLVIPLYGLRQRDLGETLAPTGYQLRPDTPVTTTGQAPRSTSTRRTPPTCSTCTRACARATQRRRRAASDHGGRSRPDAAASVGLVAISLAGVDGWMRKGAALPAWDDFPVPLKGRQALLAYDSDVTNSACTALSFAWNFLRRSGARVEFGFGPARPAARRGSTRLRRASRLDASNRPLARARGRRGRPRW